MKAEVKYTYEKEDIRAIVLSGHAATYLAPQGTKWKISDEYTYRDELIIKAVPIKEEIEEENDELPQPVVLPKPEVLPI